MAWNGQPSSNLAILKAHHPAAYSRLTPHQREEGVIFREEEGALYVQYQGGWDRTEYQFTRGKWEAVH